jgi:hypothetical protein
MVTLHLGTPSREYRLAYDAGRELVLVPGREPYLYVQAAADGCTLWFVSSGLGPLTVHLKQLLVEGYRGWDGWHHIGDRVQLAVIR